MSIFKKLIKAFNNFLDLIFPELCEACERPLNLAEKVLCLNCIYELPRTNYCKEKENPIDSIFVGRLKIERATALFIFQKGSRYRKLLHKLKYKNKPEIGVFLGKELGLEMKRSKNFQDIDFLIPVPLHGKRQKQRGYNQSEMICKGISEITKIETLNNVLVRNKETSTQTKKNRDERWKNVSGKFILSEIKKIENKHILLVDDVITTGATIEACGEVLLNTKGLRLSIATLANA